MDKLKPDGLLYTPLKKFMLKVVYIMELKKGMKVMLVLERHIFPEIKWGEVKGWNKHKKMTLNLIVPIEKLLL